MSFAIYWEIEKCFLAQEIQVFKKTLKAYWLSATAWSNGLKLLSAEESKRKKDQNSKLVSPKPPAIFLEQAEVI